MSISPSGRFSSTLSGKQGSRTLISTREYRVSSAARPTVIRLPSVITHQWTRRESNPDFRHTRAVSSLWTTSPCSSSGPPGTRTPITWVQTKRLPLGPAAHEARGPSGSRTRSSSLPRRCAAKTPTDHFATVIPAGIEPALSWLSPRRLCLWTTGSFSLSVTGVGLEPTGTRLSTSPLCQFAYPVIKWRVRGSHPGTAAQRWSSRLMRPG